MNNKNSNSNSNNRDSAYIIYSWFGVCLLVNVLIVFGISIKAIIALLIFVTIGFGFYFWLVRKLHAGKTYVFDKSALQEFNEIIANRHLYRKQHSKNTRFQDIFINHK